MLVFEGYEIGPLTEGNDREGFASVMYVREEEVRREWFGSPGVLPRISGAFALRDLVFGSVVVVC